MSDLIVQNAVNAPMQPDMFSQGPHEMVKHAATIATILKDVIVKQKLSVKIGPNEYVKAEGWSTLGCLLGFLPRERDVKELEDGSYQATVELYSMRTGQIVGQASALCGIDEKRWANADRYARRSMAITRATGKAYRLGFAWIVALAGYSPTPAEEIPEEAPDGDHQESKKTASIYTGETKQQQIIEKMLRKEKIPEDCWGEIDSRLRGKPSTELKAVIASVRSEAVRW